MMNELEDTAVAVDLLVEYSPFFLKNNYICDRLGQNKLKLVQIYKINRILLEILNYNIY